jgi:hypothetical protein
MALTISEYEGRGKKATAREGVLGVGESATGAGAVEGAGAGAGAGAEDGTLEPYASLSQSAPSSGWKLPVSRPCSKKDQIHSVIHS